MAVMLHSRMNYPFDSSRETLGLMVCHAVCGAVGALPPTGVFVRTSLNVQLRATHRMSQMINAIAVFLIFVPWRTSDGGPQSDNKMWFSS